MGEHDDCVPQAEHEKQIRTTCEVAWEVIDPVPSRVFSTAVPNELDIELDEDGLLSDGNHDDIAYEAGYLTEDEYDAANRGGGAL